MPRDVEPAAGDLEQVFLYNIDDLQTIVQENLSRRTAEASRPRRSSPKRSSGSAPGCDSRGAIPTVVALRQRFETIRRSELRRLELKLSSLPPEARARVEEITRLLVEKLLIGPTVQLKSIRDAETVAAYTDALTRLFDLTPEEAGERRELSAVAAGPEPGRDAERPAPAAGTAGKRTDP